MFTRKLPKFERQLSTIQFFVDIDAQYILVVHSESSLRPTCMYNANNYLTCKNKMPRPILVDDLPISALALMMYQPLTNSDYVTDLNKKSNKCFDVRKYFYWILKEINSISISKSSLIFFLQALTLVIHFVILYQCHWLCCLFRIKYAKMHWKHSWPTCGEIFCLYYGNFPILKFGLFHPG